MNFPDPSSKKCLTRLHVYITWSHPVVTLPDYVPAHLSLAQPHEQKSFNHLWTLPSVNTNHLYNSFYNSSCISVLLLWTIIVTICTYVLLCTRGLCYFAFIIIIVVCTVCTALLFSYSAIFIAASVRNKLIHSFVCLSIPYRLLSRKLKGIEKPKLLWTFPWEE